MFTSALSVSIVAALFSNFFLSFGTSRRVDFSSLPAATIHDHIARVEHKCDSWNVAQNVKARVMLTLRELLDDRSAALRLQFDGCTLRLEIKRHVRAGASASEVLPETFFFQHVTDRFSHRKGRGGTEVLSLYFEQ